LKYCRRAIEHGTTLNDVRQRVIGLWRLGLTYSYQGDPERGAQYCSEALALGPLPYDAATAKGAHGCAEIRAGRVDAGIADLREAVAWLDSSNLRFPRWRFSLLLSEGHLRAGDRTAARSLAEGVLEQSRGMGYLHFEGMACWLIGECLAPEDPAAAEPYVENAMGILGRIGARNDLARAMMTRAALRQAAGDVATARALLRGAYAIYQALGTLDEPLRVEAARVALDQDAPIGLLCGTSVTRRSSLDRTV
jgi:tetratricopeptide (TPR) repeat protein